MVKIDPKPRLRGCLYIGPITEERAERVLTKKNTGVYGIAKCHPDDRFSYNIGVKLATLRLIRAELKQKRYRIQRLIDRNEEGLLDLERLINLRSSPPNADTAFVSGDIPPGQP